MASRLPELAFPGLFCHATRAHRLKIARRLTGFTLEDIPEKFGISKHTFYAWESGRNPLQDKAIPKIITALHQAGIYCTAEWLMEGEGLSPRFRYEISEDSEVLAPRESDISKEREDLYAEEAIFSEIKMFQKVNKNTDVRIISEEAMSPLYNPGDYVGGIRFFEEEDINEKALNMNCIVESMTGDIYIRRLSQGSCAGVYHLSSLNLSSKVEKCVVYDVSILSAAPIVWHRKILH